MASARAHEKEIIRAHRLLCARRAGLTSVGCSSRALELARLSTNWIASEPYPGHDGEAAPIASQQLCVFCLLVRPGPLANAAVHSGRSRPGLSVAR